MKDSRGENLIFLISLPRSGSTLLQKILCGNSDIHTTSEPWIMLHPIYALRHRGHSAEYNETFASGALEIFLKNLPNDEETYIEGLRLMFSHIYDAALTTPPKKYFMDKTPRYYEIIPELYKIFPDAKFILLLRNPIAALNSRIHISGKRNFKSLNMYKRDILNGPEKLSEGIQLLGKKCTVVCYENFVEQPDVELKKLCTYLGITYSSTLLNYNSDNKDKWEYGDPQTVYNNSKPSNLYKDSWHGNLTHPQLWRLYSDYCTLLGERIYESLGYDFSEVVYILDKMKPNRFKLLMTRPLSSFMK